MMTTQALTWAQRMSGDMRIAGLSERTEAAYVRAVRQLSKFQRGRSPDELSADDVRDYLVWLRGEKRAAPGTLKIAINGLRFYYRHTCPRDWQVLDKFRIPPKRKLPTVLTVAEVRRIIDAAQQLRIRTYLWTVYSCGLRLQEAALRVSRRAARSPCALRGVMARWPPPSAVLPGPRRQRGDDLFGVRLPL